MNIPLRRGIAGKYIVIPLTIVMLVVAVIFMIIRHSGRGAAEENFLLLSYTAGIRDIDDGYYVSAIKNLTPVVEAGGRPDAWGFRGEAYLQLAEYKKAEADFRQAIKREPETAVNYAGLAAALAGQNKFPAALEAIDQAIARFPENADRDEKTVPRTGDSLKELKSHRAEIAARIEDRG